MPVSLRIYLLCLAGLLGAVLGSFINCVAIRNGSGESAVRGRSHCMSCGATLGFPDLIPVFSYIFLRGKCRHCGARLPVRYLLTELLSATAFVVTLLCLGFTLDGLQALILFCLLLYIALRDIGEYIVPDIAVLLLLAVRIVFILVSGDVLNELIFSGIGAVSISVPVLVISLIMDKILKKETMGGGDIKLFFATGAYLGWKSAIIALIISCITGIVVAIVSMRRNNTAAPDSDAENDKTETVTSDKNSAEPQTQHGMIPFAPSIAFGAFMTVFIGEPILSFYIGLFN